jgi:hypothetical protein
VSLRNALAALSDDRATRVAAGEVLAYIRGVTGEVDAGRVARVTGVSLPTVERILGVLVGGLVLDCSGDPPQYTYHADTVNDLEVSRFLRSRSTHDSRTQVSIDRFRNRFGSR